MAEITLRTAAATEAIRVMAGHGGVVVGAGTVLRLDVGDGRDAAKAGDAAIGVDLDGHRDILGIWPGAGGGESAKFWLAVLTDLKNRGVADVFFLVCDGLKGLPDSVTAVFPRTTVQTCIIHLIRNTFRYATR